MENNNTQNYIFRDNRIDKVIMNSFSFGLLPTSIFKTFTNHYLTYSKPTSICYMIEFKK